MKPNYPSPCNCCVCRGVHCLVYHEGHDHTIKEGKKKHVIPNDDWDAFTDPYITAFMEWKP